MGGRIKPPIGYGESGGKAFPLDEETRGEITEFKYSLSLIIAN